MSSLKVSSVSKAYGATRVINGLSLHVGSGDVLAIMGRSGSGKSTLLRLLSLLESPDQGDAWVGSDQYLAGGRATSDPVFFRRKLALVFQDHNLLPNLTVMQNCTLAPRRNFGTPRAEAEAVANQILTALEVELLADRYPHTLSGGQAQRVAIARAILTRPEVLLLDEVTSALDPESTHSVLAALERARGLESAAGVAMILVTHHLRFAVRFATRIAVLEGGSIVEEFPANEFIQKGFSETARSFIEQDAVT